jgi:hypothetical protein
MSPGLITPLVGDRPDFMDASRDFSSIVVRLPSALPAAKLPRPSVA